MTVPQAGQILRNGSGQPVLRYVRTEFNGRPWADRAEPLAPHAATAVIAQLPGWRVSGSVEFGAELVTLGATEVRHSHTMWRDLRLDRSPTEASEPPDGVRLAAGLDHPFEEMWALNQAAFPPDHPDLRREAPGVERRGELFAELLAGRILGPVLPGSARALGPTGELVGLIAVLDNSTVEGRLPWIASVCRAPGPQWRGVGAVLVRHAVAATAAGGRDRIGLAVTEGNPARGLYEQLGFVVTETKLAVQIPARP